MGGGEALVFKSGYDAYAQTLKMDPKKYMAQFKNIPNGNFETNLISLFHSKGSFSTDFFPIQSNQNHTLFLITVLGTLNNVCTLKSTVFSFLCLCF